MCSVHFWKRFELKLQLVLSLLESLPCSLFPLLFPLFLKDLHALIFPLLCCSLRVSSAFFFPFFFCFFGVFFCCFIFPFSCRGNIVCFSFSFCNTGISVRSVLLFSSISVWPWQWLEIELSHRAAARATGNVLLRTSTTQPANPPRCFHGLRKESRSTARRGCFSHLYTNVHLNCLVSSHTMDFEFLRF